MYTPQVAMHMTSVAGRALVSFKVISNKQPRSLELFCVLVSSYLQ